jgi:glycerophosphoryl diester phosphodiesterase
VIGHRGNRAHAPENTLESLAQAAALGADALEFDVHLSRDGVPVLLHDPTLDRTTDASGPVRDRTVAELAKVDAGARFTADAGRTFPWRGRGIHVPTLEEALVAHPSIPLVIEMKTVEVAEPALAVIRRLGAEARVVVGSFLDAALAPFQRAGIATCGATEALKGLYLPALLGRWPRALPFQALCIPTRWKWLPIPVGRFASLMRDRGHAVHVWTVNSAAEARALWAKGVSGIITDDPGAILAARERFFPSAPQGAEAAA